MIPPRCRIAWRSAHAWMIAPVAAEIPDAWADVPPRDAMVALGWQGLLRVLRAGPEVHHRAPWAAPVVRRANLVGVGVDDIDEATTPGDLTALLRPGATMLLTDGVHGGNAYDVGEGGAIAAVRHWHSIPIREYVDPVGAGRLVPRGRVRGARAPVDRGGLDGRRPGPSPRGGLRIADPRGARAVRRAPPRGCARADGGRRQPGLNDERGSRLGRQPAPEEDRMAARLGIGVVGLGRMGSMHARYVARGVPGAKVVAVADFDRDRARAMGVELDVADIFGSAAELAAYPAVDAVLLATPSVRHPDDVIAVGRGRQGRPVREAAVARGGRLRDRARRGAPGRASASRWA